MSQAAQTMARLCMGTQQSDSEVIDLISDDEQSADGVLGRGYFPRVSMTYHMTKPVN
jgi:hypothetical protein